MASSFNEHFSDAAMFHFLHNPLLFCVFFINHIAGSLLHSACEVLSRFFSEVEASVGNLGRSRWVTDLSSLQVFLFHSSFLSGTFLDMYTETQGQPCLQQHLPWEWVSLASNPPYMLDWLTGPGAPGILLSSFSSARITPPHLAFYICEGLN